MGKTLDPFTRTVAIFKAYYGIPRDLQDMEGSCCCHAPDHSICTSVCCFIFVAKVQKVKHRERLECRESPKLFKCFIKRWGELARAQ